VKNAAASVLLVGKHPHKLQLTVNAGIDAVSLDDFAPDRSVDVVVDATGRPEGFELALRTVRPQGVVVLKSTFASGDPLNMAPVVIDEIKVIGSRCGPMAEAIAALDSGRVEVTDLISARFDLSRGVEALGAAEGGRNIKVLIDVQHGVVS
jgi:threonine dehydrogenase-like Zn-dependent dehydrogenase